MRRQTSSETRDAFASYAALRSKGGRHIEPKPGDRLPFNDVEVTVVSSGGSTLTRADARRGRGERCVSGEADPAGDPDENPRSTGVVVRFGKFRFLDVGDLSGQPLFDLVCPKNLIGPVDAYLTAHHGGADAAEPATLSSIPPARRDDEQRAGERRPARDVRSAPSRRRLKACGNCIRPQMPAA